MVISYFFLQCWMLYSQLNDNESESDNHSVMSDSLWPHGLHGILQARILEWVVIPFSRGTSQPKDRTQVSHIAGRFFISWATRILEWVVYPFSRGSSWPSNQNRVSCIAGGFFTSWATREAHMILEISNVFQSSSFSCQNPILVFHGQLLWISTH